MTIVEMIIKQCENSKQGKDWILGKEGNRTLKPELWVEALGQQKRDFLAELLELGEEGKNLLQIRWQERGNQPLEIHFRLQDLPVFYQLSGRKSKDQKVHEYSELLEKLIRQTKSDWIQSYYQDLRIKVSKGNLTEIEKCHELLWTTLTAIDQLTEPAYKRAFSKRFLNHSKIFEKELQNKIVSIAKNYHPELQEVDEMLENGEESDKNRKWCTSEVLSQLYIEDYSQELSVKGSLKITIEEETFGESGKEQKEMDLGDYPYGTILNSETLKHVKPQRNQEIRKVVIVENKANYIAMPYEKGTLIIFCHGFFTPKEREFLCELKQVLDDDKVEYYHTGDLDFGGIRIFLYNRDHIFPELRPLYMDVQTYRNYLEYGEQMDGKKIEKLRGLKDEQLQPLINEMIKEKVEIEQEIMLST